MKRLFLAGLAVAALASCSKEETMDVSISTAQIPIQYSAYAGSSVITKSNPVDTNAEFAAAGRTFEVSAYAALTGGTLGQYFGFSTVTYDSSNSDWANTDVMYYPNTDGTLYYGAYSPSPAAENPRLTNGAYSYDATNGHSLTFKYTVVGDVDSNGTTVATGTVANHEDLMYATASKKYDAPIASEAGNDSSVDSDMKVNLHFKHALTQVAFSATKDDNLDVTVNSITLCNIANSGSFTADVSTDDNDDDGTDDQTLADSHVDMTKAGSWSEVTGITHYKAAMATTPVTVGADATDLTDANDALMLIPQTLTAWEYADTTGTGTEGSLGSVTGTGSYLAINCTIMHTGSTISIIDGLVFVPFSTAGIKYESGDAATDGWKSGYKITYNLHFGGGYVDPTPGTTPDEIPTPGNTPDPDDLVPTLRAITYTTSVDAWETANTSPSINL